jgi:glutamyl-tRNA synthetase
MPFPTPALTVISAPIQQSRTLHEYIASILREGARTYTTAEAFVSENQALFTQRLDRPAYSPTTSITETAPAPGIPVSDLHTAAAALCIVPPAFWTADTHRANINAYQYSLPPTPNPVPDIEAKSQSEVDQPFRKELFHYLRWALLAGAPGVGIPAAMEILGREETVRRLEEARRLTGGTDEPGRRGVRETVGEDKAGEWMGSLAGLKSGSGSRL